MFQQRPTRYCNTFFITKIIARLPGIRQATGATLEETERLLREAIALHLEGMKDDGLPIPDPSGVVDYLELEACV